MKGLEMMYVYFDTNGDIKRISPDQTSDQTSDKEKYNVCTFPLSDVEEFLRGKRNPFNFMVKTTRAITGETYSIVKKQTVNTSQVRTLDSFLTEVTTSLHDYDIVVIENILNERVVKIYLDKDASVAIKESNDAELLDLFLAHKDAFLFFTRKHDPSYLEHTIVFSPHELLDRNYLEFKYDIDLSNSSLYTKKIINRYNYIVR